MRRSLNPLSGVILVSFGPSGDYLPQETVTRLLRVLANVEHDVVFRYNRSVQGVSVPETVHLVPAVPHLNRLLAHDKLKLFISSCDSVSLIQSVYHRKPMLAFPLAENQHANAAFLASRGFGKVLDITAFSEAQLAGNIREVLASDKIRQNLHKAGDILRDMKKHNVSQPSFWIEHVIKYDSAHLRSHAYSLPLYQYLMLDVIALGLFFLLAFVMVTLPVLRLTCGLYKWSCTEYKTIGRIN